MFYVAGALLYVGLIIASKGENSHNSSFSLGRTLALGTLPYVKSRILVMDDAV